MSKTKIIKCTCSNSYQDNRYGASKRVMNATLKGKTSISTTWRCTVCKSEITK